MHFAFNPFMTEPISYRNQSIDLRGKYDRGLRPERFKCFTSRDSAGAKSNTNIFSKDRKFA